SKAKAEAQPAEDEDKEEGEGEKDAASSKKPGLIGRVLGLLAFANPMAFLKLSMMMKLIVGGGTLGVIGLLAAGYYFLAPAASENPEAAAENVQTTQPNLPPATAAFFEIPDIIVNIQTPDASQAFLKLSVSLELEKAEAKAAVEPVLPRVIDQFQSY